MVSGVTAPEISPTPAIRGLSTGCSSDTSISTSPAVSFFCILPVLTSVASSMELSPTAQHLLYVLLDSNLPTGGFVASSGLESYAKHGFLANNVQVDAYDEAEIDDILAHLASLSSSETASGQKAKFAARRRNGPTSAQGNGNVTKPTVQFIKYELDNFHNSTGSYLRRAYSLVAEYLAQWTEEDEGKEAELVSKLAALDAEQESTLLSQVQRRASKTQGIALLTLYGRGLAPPASFFSSSPSSSDASVDEAREDAKKSLISSFKLAVRKQKAHGHLSLCFGIICALLEIPPHMAQHVYLFTHLRSILSAAVRLNLIGPYLSTQILSWDGKRIIDETRDVARPADCAAPPDESWDARISQPVVESGDWKPAQEKLDVADRKPTKEQLDAADVAEGSDPTENGATAAEGEEDIWAWAKACEAGPCTTWPLIEILTSRHDLQHSRIFNS